MLWYQVCAHIPNSSCRRRPLVRGCTHVLQLTSCERENLLFLAVHAYRNQMDTIHASHSIVNLLSYPDLHVWQSLFACVWSTRPLLNSSCCRQSALLTCMHANVLNPFYSSGGCVHWIRLYSIVYNSNYIIAFNSVELCRNSVVDEFGRQDIEETSTKCDWEAISLNL